MGIIAAQSIGEPGTQLTLRTFHTGGVAGGSDITQGLPRVQELFEARDPKGQGILAHIGGRVQIRAEGDERWATIISTQIQRVPHAVPGNYAIKVSDGDIVEEGDLLASRKGQEDVVATTSGRVASENGTMAIVHEDREEREYVIPVTARMSVADGQMVEPGHMVTEGSRNPHEILAILGVEALRDHMVTEIQQVYRSQGVSINDKHIEIIVRQMLRRVSVTASGDSEMLPGELVDRLAFEEMNQEILEGGGEPATAEPVVLGITKAALNTDSFLSAASFQHTISILAAAAIEGKVDNLLGLKESVLIGKLIPAGSGFKERSATHDQPEEAFEQIADSVIGSDEGILGGLGEGLFSADPNAELDALDAAFLASSEG